MVIEYIDIENNNEMEAIMRTILLTLMTATLIFAAGCEVDRTIYIHEPLPAPTGVTSITGDNEVYILWYPIESERLDCYLVYRNTSGPNETFYLQEVVSYNRTSWTDTDVENGETYFYCMAACDVDGIETRLSDYTYDTPRPEGFDISIYDSNTPEFDHISGYDLYYQERLPFDDDYCDFYLSYDDFRDTYSLNLRHDLYYIQDFGYADTFDDIGYAPEDGWSAFSDIEAIEGHMYILKLWHFEEWHYARIWVTELQTNPPRMRFSWAYQVAAENRELKIAPYIIDYEVATERTVD